MPIKLIAFKGLVPRTDPRLLGEMQAQTAKNVDLTTGILKAIPQPGAEATLGISNAQTIFPYNGSWLAWDKNVDVQRSPILDDQRRRIYYTGDGVPKVRGLRIRVDSAAFTLGQKVRWSSGDTVWQVTTAGTTAATEPSIAGKVVGNTVTDNTVIWTMLALTTVGANELEYNLGIPKPTNAITAAAQAQISVSWTRAWKYHYEKADGTITQSGTLREGTHYTDLIDNVALTPGSGTRARFTAAGHGFLAGDTCIITNLTAPLDVYNGTRVIQFVSDDNHFDIDIGSYTGGTPAGTESLLGQVHQVTPGKAYRMHTTPARTTAGSTDTLVVYFDALSSGGSSLGRLYPGISAYSGNTDFVLSGASASGLQTLQASNPQHTLTISYDTSRASDYEVTRNYVYTFVSDWGEEGPPSTPSADVDVDPTQDAQLSNMDTSVAGNYNITKKRIYRTVTSAGGTFYQLVVELAIATATYLDQVIDEDTEDVLPSTGWIAPPSGLKGLVMLPGGYMAGFVTRTVYFSEPYQPHAWPVSYALTVDYDCIGLGVEASGLVVLTDGLHYLMVGHSPDAITQEAIDTRQACVSKRSIVSGGGMGQAVLYASPDGLAAIEGGTAFLVTEKFYTRSQWQALVPSSMIGEIHDQVYFGFGSGGKFRFDFDAGESALTTTDITVQALKTDLETDKLYLVNGTALTSWATGTGNLTYTWKSKVFEFPSRRFWRVVRVRAATYPVTFNMYIDGSLATTLAIQNDSARKLPKVPRGTILEFEIVASSDIHEVLLSESMRIL